MPEALNEVLEVKDVTISMDAEVILKNKITVFYKMFMFPY